MFLADACPLVAKNDIGRAEISAQCQQAAAWSRDNHRIDSIYRAPTCCSFRVLPRYTLTVKQTYSSSRLAASMALTPGGCVRKCGFGLSTGSRSFQAPVLAACSALCVQGRSETLLGSLTASLHSIHTFLTVSNSYSSGRAGATPARRRATLPTRHGAHPDRTTAHAGEPRLNKGPASRGCDLMMLSSLRTQSGRATRGRASSGASCQLMTRAARPGAAPIAPRSSRCCTCPVGMPAMHCLPLRAGALLSRCSPVQGPYSALCNC